LKVNCVLDVTGLIVGLLILTELAVETIEVTVVAFAIPVPDTCIPTITPTIEDMYKVEVPAA
jgi:hypothetical protein